MEDKVVIDREQLIELANIAAKLSNGMNTIYVGNVRGAKPHQIEACVTALQQFHVDQEKWNNHIQQMGILAKEGPSPPNPESVGEELLHKAVEKEPIEDAHHQELLHKKAEKEPIEDVHREIFEHLKILTKSMASNVAVNSSDEIQRGIMGVQQEMVKALKDISDAVSQPKFMTLAQRTPLNFEVYPYNSAGGHGYPQQGPAPTDPSRGSSEPPHKKPKHAAESR